MGLFAGFFVQLDGVIQALNECIRQPDNFRLKVLSAKLSVMINSMTENNRQFGTTETKVRVDKMALGSPKLKREHWRVRLVAREMFVSMGQLLNLPQRCRLEMLLRR